jgi:endonuclease/exonuclease/phosphatase family metal-dependent hydrolase
MKIYTFVVLIMVSYLTIYIQPIPAHASDTLKILTFNIYGAPDSDWEIREGMILEELETLLPDFIGLQEIVQNPAAGVGPDNRAKLLADSLYYRTGIRYDFRYAYTHFSWGQFDEGIAILSRHIILDSDFFDLPPGNFARKALWGRILSPGGVVNFFNTHLSFGGQEPVRIQQVRAIKPYIEQINSDSVALANILCGDFNAIPSSPPILLLTLPDSSGIVYLDSWNEANPGVAGYTMPSNNPNARIDYIFLRDDEYGEIISSDLVLNQPNANNIYPSDHIGVLSQIVTGIHSVGLNIISPQAGQAVSGQTNISWSMSSQVQPVIISIYLSNDGGQSWWEEWSGPSGSNSYNWNTNLVPDGTRYLLQVAAWGDTSYGLAKTTGRFTVNNPGNVPPEIELFSPRGGENWSGINTVQWIAADADGDPLTISLDISTDDGTSWESLASNLPNDSLYLWDTPQYSNSPFYLLRLRANDGTHEVVDTSNMFVIFNPRTPLPSSIFQHPAGTASATLNALVVDPAQITGHQYRITFNDTLPPVKTYDVEDLNTSQTVISNATQLDGLTEGPYFDGMRLLIRDFDPAEVNQDSSRWLIGNSTLEINIFLPSINIGGTIYQGFANPADYTITVFDQVVDTSSTAFGAPAIPMKFTVWNDTENRRSEIIYDDQGANGSISRFDIIYILEPDSLGQPQFSWALSFGGLPTVTAPLPGDVYRMTTLKPLTYLDIYTFNSTVFIGEIGNRTQPGGFRLYQNYPNPFNPRTVIRFELAEKSHTQLTIFDILGREVAILVDQQQPAGFYHIQFDASNLASGIFFYRLEAGDLVSTKKMILMK